MPRTTARQPRLSWKAAIYYGEVVGFLLAWVAGVAALTHDWQGPRAEVSIDRVAVIDANESWGQGR